MKYLALLAFVITITSCKYTSKEASSNTPEISVEETATLKLNNGEKWIANIETHDGVKNMDSILKVFKLGSVKDYAALGNDLSQQTSVIIKKCSMKGEPHDQLHVVLVPMLDEISIIKESESEALSEKALHKLEALITDYFKHFTT